jgi:hypothetical protein
MVIGRITSYLALGLLGVYLINALVRPQSALGTASVLTETGTGIASIGSGIGESLRSIGSGSAKLFDPLFTLKDLIYDSRVPGSANVSPTAQNEGLGKDPSSSTITWSSGTTRTVPTLSAAAKSYYRSRGVSVA